LEHARIYYFYNQGKEKIYLSSADWMNRNLNKRIEVAFPVLNKSLKNQICYGFDLQWADNTKLTSISENEVKSNQAHEKAVRAQYAMYYWLKENTTNLIN
jgi:polyphosphate kinase